MSKRNSRSMQITVTFAATLAALGVSVGVPVEDALAAQLLRAHGDPAPRTPPVELAFSLIEQPGQGQGTADSSKRSTEIAAFEAYRVRKQGMGDGSKQGMGDDSVKPGAHPGGVNARQLKFERKNRTGATQYKLRRSAVPGGQAPAPQLPAVKR